jgi:hypothetical protein
MLRPTGSFRPVLSAIPLLGLTLAAGHAATGPTPGPPAVELTVSVDTTEVPELAPWADQAKRLCEAWYPKIAALLASDGYTPPKRVRLVFKKDMKGVAGTAGTTIMIASSWVTQHPDDLGMVIHELTHVVQSYPSYRAGWLVEGIADYVRFVKYEPGHPQPPIDPEKASYRAGYRTTFRFLDWIERTHKGLIAQLNAALRQGRYEDALFHDLTGKSLDELWKNFLATLPRRKAGRSRRGLETRADRGSPFGNASELRRLPEPVLQVVDQGLGHGHAGRGDAVDELLPLLVGAAQAAEVLGIDLARLADRPDGAAERAVDLARQDGAEVPQRVARTGLRHDLPGRLHRVVPQELLLDVVGVERVRCPVDGVGEHLGCQESHGASTV